jgi:hypothetical protein
VVLLRPDTAPALVESLWEQLAAQPEAHEVPERPHHRLDQGRAVSLAQPFKSGRRGLLLNPGDIEDDSLPSTSLGRVSPDFTPGRGDIVGRGKVR